MLLNLTDNGNVVYSNITSISPSWTDILVPWTPSSVGLHNLSIEVQPYIECDVDCPNIAEINETDNVYNISLEVGMYIGIFYCDDHFDCPAEHYCEGGACYPLPICNTSQDCAAGFYCNNDTKLCDYCLDCEAVACTIVYPECNLTCNESFDCAKGYICSPLGVCVLSAAAAASTSLPEFNIFLILILLILSISASVKYLIF